MNLFETAKDHLVVVAHSGVMGIDIPCNTMISFEIALTQGADMLEMDLNIIS